MNRSRLIDLALDAENPQTRNECRKLFLRIEDIWTDHEEFMRSLNTTSEHDLWGGQRTARFISWVDEQVKEGTQARRFYSGDAWDQARYYVSNLSRDFKMLVETGLRSSECTGLFAELHQRAALATFDAGPAPADATIRALSDLALSDFGQLDWGQILDLRTNGFIQDFRRKFTAWSDGYGDPAKLTAEISELVQNAMFAYIGETQPNLATSVFSAAVGAVPPLAALSTAKAVFDIGAQAQRRRKYRWLYFLCAVRKLQTGAT